MIEKCIQSAIHWRARHRLARCARRQWDTLKKMIDKCIQSAIHWRARHRLARCARRQWDRLKFGGISPYIYIYILAGHRLARRARRPWDTLIETWRNYICIYIYRLPNWSLEEGFPIDETPWLKMIQFKALRILAVAHTSACKTAITCMGVCTWSANRFTSLHSHHHSAYSPTLLATIQVIIYIRILDIVWYCDHGWTHKSNWIKLYGWKLFS